MPLTQTHNMHTILRTKNQRIKTKNTTPHPQQAGTMPCQCSRPLYSSHTTPPPHRRHKAQNATHAAPDTQQHTNKPHPQPYFPTPPHPVANTQPHTEHTHAEKQPSCAGGHPPGNKTKQRNNHNQLLHKTNSLERR